MRKLLICIALSMTMGACASTASYAEVENGPAQADTHLDSAVVEKSMRSDYSAGFVQDSRGLTREAPLEGAALRIERAGWIRVSSGEEMEASKRLRRMAPTFDATVMSFNSYSVAFKLPSAKLEQLLETIDKTEGWEIDEFDFSAWDRTGEFYSVEARLASAKLVKERLTKLLESANTLEDVLKIHAKLEDIQKKLDEYHGQTRDIELKAGRVDVLITFD